MPHFEIDADIRRARTLPSEFYTDEQFFDLSRERIFARAWHFAGRTIDLQTLQPLDLLPGVLDECLVLSKQGDTVRCLSNVCTHRGKLLVEAGCTANLIRCGYHGRRFSLDGKFLSMPEFGGVEDFPSKSDDLTQIACTEWNELLFVSLDPVADLEEFVGDAAKALGPFSPNDPEFAGRREYEINAHWALYCENYLEGFHIPYVHKGLNEAVDYGSYTTHTFRYSSLQTAHNGDGQIAAQYLFIFPNLMFNYYPWGLSINVVKPIAPDKTAIEFLTYVRDTAQMDKGAGVDLHTVELEDEAVVESVQKGIRSRFYSHGRYSPTREQGTHHFHRLIAEFIN